MHTLTLGELGADLLNTNHQVNISLGRHPSESSVHSPKRWDTAVLLCDGVSNEHKSDEAYDYYQHANNIESKLQSARGQRWWPERVAPPNKLHLSGWTYVTAIAQ